ncbi:MAG: universal stress protein [Flavobacteriales bacterium]|nr:universal stress protein [Flavobacteriales bacterium]
MKTILIPTDFSENSNYALEYASFIAKSKGGELIILHITKDEGSVLEKLQKVRDLPFFKGLTIKVIIRKGKSISKTINKVGIEFDVDLILMGSNGISNVGELLLGSNTENVIRNSQFNVLTIKHKMLDLSLNTVLFPSDFSSESYAIFEIVKKFADSFNAQIHLLRVVTSDQKKGSETISNKMDALITHFQLPENSYKKIIFRDTTKELGVLNYSIKSDIDMIAIGSHGKGIVRKLVKESISQNLVRDTFRPILTVRF